MKKSHLFLVVTAGLFLSGCSGDEFTGNIQSESEKLNNTAINFDGGSEAITRASTADDISKLQGQFVVYGVKSGATAGSNMQKVFTNYRMWNSTAGAAANTTNAQGWEYVGGEGTTGLGIGNIELIQDQTIKYWDTSAADYRFVAGSPVGSFSFTVDANNNVTHTTVTGIDAHIKANSTSGEGTALSHDAIYVADPVIVSKTDYGKAVKFQFTGQQALVRVGLYETIPGYSVSTINFYAHNGTDWAETPGRNIVLNSLTDKDYFIGGSNMTATLTYDWSVPTYSFHYDTEGDVTSRSWYAGAFNAGVPSTTSSATAIDKLYGTDKDMATNTGYFPVLPTATDTEATPLVIKCDYTLTSTDGSGETIVVNGATAAIPAAFARWEKNHAYTYLFKISDKTHGSAGTLMPIVFDAAIVSGASNRDGFITTVSVPSITSYQLESPYTTVDNDAVTGTGVKYAPNKDIIVTVQDNASGDLKALSALDNTNPAVGMIKVYYLGTTEVTESDLQLTRPTEHATEKPTTNIPQEAFDFHGKTMGSVSLAGVDKWDIVAKYDADSVKTQDNTIIVRDNPPYAQTGRYYYFLKSINASPFVSRSLAVSWRHQGPRVLDVPIELSGSYDDGAHLTWFVRDDKLPGGEWHFCIYRKGPEDKNFKYYMSAAQGDRSYREHTLEKGEKAEYYIELQFEDGRHSQSSNTVSVTAE